MGAVMYVKTNVPQSLMVCFHSSDNSMCFANSIRCRTRITMSSANPSMHSIVPSFQEVVLEVKEPSLDLEVVSSVSAQISAVQSVCRRACRAYTRFARRQGEFHGIVPCETPPLVIVHFFVIHTKCLQSTPTLSRPASSRPYGNVPRNNRILHGKAPSLLAMEY